MFCCLPSIEVDIVWVNLALGTSEPVEVSNPTTSSLLSQSREGPLLLCLDMVPFVVGGPFFLQAYSSGLLLSWGKSSWGEELVEVSENTLVVVSENTFARSVSLDTLGRSNILD